MAGKHHSREYKDKDEHVEKFMQYLFRDDGRRSPYPYCLSVEDGLDGFFVHNEDCPNVGKGFTGGSSCSNGYPRRYRGYPQSWMDRTN